MAQTKKQLALQSKILDQIYTHGSISRIDIAHNTGITPATTTNLTAELVNKGLVIETDIDATENKVGRKKVLLKIAPNYSHYIGVELHEQFIAFCLVDNLGTILKKNLLTISEHKIPTGATFAEHLAAFLNDCQAYCPQAIGIALPGHYNQTTQQIISNRLSWQKFDLKPVIAKIKLPLFFENNVHCMSTSYRLLSQQIKNDNMLFLHVARGIFSSYLYRGKIHGQNNFLVGEIGHWIVNPEGELCDCGRRGCLQNYISQGAIIKKAVLLYETSSSTYLRQLVKSTAEIDFYVVQKAYELGDDGVINILNNAMKYLAITLNNLVMMADTHQLVLHGALFNSNNLFELLKHYLNENRFQLTNISQQHLIVKQYDQFNGAAGAAIFAMQKDLGIF